MDLLINIPPIEMPGIFVCKSIVMRGKEGGGGGGGRRGEGKSGQKSGTECKCTLPTFLVRNTYVYTYLDACRV